jgi:hypothetical protein
VDVGLCVLVLLPLVILAVNARWLYTCTGEIDPWVYVGYYLDLRNHLRAFAGTYYGTRLTAILPGVVAYQCFPPLIANYVLHLARYYAGVLALYYTLKLTVSNRAAFLGALGLGCHHFYLCAVGWDYVDGSGVVYLLLATLFLTLAARRPHWPAYLITGGACVAALAFANLFYIVFTPFPLIHYLVVNRQYRRNSFLLSLLLGTAGAVALTLLCCLVQYWATGQFWFFKATVDFAVDYVAKPNPYKAATYAWLKGANWLLVPCLTLAGMVPFALKARAAIPGRGMAWFYQVSFLAAVAMLVGWEAYGVPRLQYFYYSSLLIPAAFLALGSQFGAHVETLTPRAFAVLSGLAITGLVVGIACEPLGEELSKLAPYAGIIGAAICFPAFALLVIRAPDVVRSGLLLLILLAVPDYVSRCTFSFGGKRLPTRLVGTEPVACPITEYRQDCLKAVVRGVKIGRATDHTADFKFWYDVKEDTGSVYTALASCYLWGWRMVNTHFPEIDKPENVLALKDTKVLILSEDPAILDRANASLHRIGMEARLIKQCPVHQSSVNFFMTFVRLEPLPHSPP